ncbi:DUF3135 domain-containing protein [Propionivibrio limicola]|uniref:DUF3135 domain-containing protein n=1 Tax=Propionivibrio limicola TaxID=167645 RepID=UPI001291B1CA|nr:DUF3135 domain-containing protein [Propionivibrio limicola]
MKNESDFIFEEWAFLARVDPEAFEIRRRKAIGEFLGTSGRQRVLGEMLQRRIDAARVEAETPQAALVVIARMLCEELDVLGNELQALRDQMGKIRRNSELPPENPPCA